MVALTPLASANSRHSRPRGRRCWLEGVTPGVRALRGGPLTSVRPDRHADSRSVGIQAHVEPVCVAVRQTTDWNSLRSCRYMTANVQQEGEHRQGKAGAVARSIRSAASEDGVFDHLASSYCQPLPPASVGWESFERVKISAAQARSDASLRCQHRVKSSFNRLGLPCRLRGRCFNLRARIASA